MTRSTVTIARIFRLRPIPLLCFALYVVLGLLGAPLLSAQTTSTIQGTVTDKQGLAISGAELRLSGDTIGTSRTMTSDSAGAYAFQNLPAGLYTLSVSHAGFSTRAFQDLDVTLNRS